MRNSRRVCEPQELPVEFVRIFFLLFWKLEIPLLFATWCLCHERLRRVLCREVVIAPFNLLNLHFKFDVDATVEGALHGVWDSEEGQSPQRPFEPKSALAGAIRLGISRALVPFVGNEVGEIMRRGKFYTFAVCTPKSLKRSTNLFVFTKCVNSF